MFWINEIQKLKKLILKIAAPLQSYQWSKFMSYFRNIWLIKEIWSSNDMKLPLPLGPNTIVLLGHLIFNSFKDSIKACSLRFGLKSSIFQVFYKFFCFFPISFLIWREIMIQKCWEANVIIKKTFYYVKDNKLATEWTFIRL